MSTYRWVMHAVDFKRSLSDLITELATHSRKAAFPREAGKEGRHTLVDKTYANPYLSRCSGTAVTEVLYGW